MVAKWKISMVWVVWLIGWPLLLWVAYDHYYVNISGYFWDIILFTLFMCIVALFPLKINNTSLFFINGISIAVFLTFGLFIEMVLSSIAILIVIIQERVSAKDLYRIPLNILLFSAVSIISAEFYALLGGSHSLDNYQNEFIAMFGYAASIIIVNLALVKLAQRIMLGTKVKIFDKSLRWEFTSSLLVIPVGFVLFLLYTEIGQAAIFFLSIPFISISIVLKLLYSYHEINRYLKKTGEIGHQLAQKLEVTEVYDVFMNELVQLMPVDYAYVYVTKNDHLQLVRFVDVKHQSQASHSSIEKDEAFSGRTFTSRKALIFRNKKEWSHITSSVIPKEAESILSIPIEYGDTIKGIVTIVSTKEKAYEKIHQRIAKILSNYLGVAIENAKHYEITKMESEKDGLTNLYNYRYLEKELTEYFTSEERLSHSFFCSMLIVDLDHFKKVNDTYGHEAGNEILKEMATRLKNIVGKRGLVARYGGEEFTIFLPELELSDALDMAETIRKEIKENPFVVHKHILQHSKPVEVVVTASIGVSNYPEHCEEPNELIRHADRAMYIGAKRRGRNKVAVYNHIKEEVIL